MSGYIGLNRTGFAPFDDALSLIEDAGDAYHHTSQWIDDGWNGEKSYLDQINESIAFAAKSYLNLQEQIIELTRQRGLAVEALEWAAVVLPPSDPGGIGGCDCPVCRALETIKESDVK